MRQPAQRGLREHPPRLSERLPDELRRQRQVKLGRLLALLQQFLEDVRGSGLKRGKRADLPRVFGAVHLHVRHRGVVRANQTRELLLSTCDLQRVADEILILGNAVGHLHH